MQAHLQLAGVGYMAGHRRLFTNLNLPIAQGHTLGITGPNGSGKSTLVNILYGMRNATEGKVTLTINGEPVEDVLFSRYISLATPYLVIPEELTVAETFRIVFLARQGSIPTSQMPAAVGLAQQGGLRVSLLSSGQMQRLRLGIALLDACPIALLDEPLQNLDTTGKDLYRQLFAQNVQAGRTLIVAGNDTDEYGLCSQVLSLG